MQDQLEQSVSGMELVKLKFDVAEAWGQLGNPEEGERLPLEAVTKTMVNTQ
jgi:hypothetical protein